MPPERIEQAVLLAAGRGTRLGELTATRPKPLLEVGGQPILGRILRGLAGAGIRRVLVVSGYLAEQLESAIGDGATFGPRVQYRRQDRLEGTARALAQGRDFTAGRPFFFGWGDILVEPENYARVLAAMAGADAVLAVNAVDDPAAGAAVYLDANRRMRRIVEKPAPGSSTTPWNNAGFGVLGAPIWPAIEALTPSPRGEFELPEALASLLAAGAVVRAVLVEGPWFDIGTPEALARARAYFGQGQR